MPVNVAGYADPVVAPPEREDVPSHAVGQAEDKAEDGIRRLRAPLKRQRPEREDLAPASREERLGKGGVVGSGIWSPSSTGKAMSAAERYNYDRY